MNTTANKIEVMWDKSDPSSPGWAWYALDADGELIDSGAVRGRQRESQTPSRRRVLRSVSVRYVRGIPVVCA